MAESLRAWNRRTHSRIIVCVCLGAFTFGVPARLMAAATDQVLEWMQITNDTVLAAGTSPLFTARNVAIVSASVFDAVNGIDRNYRPFFVKTRAPHGASARAAAIQSAYAILVELYTTPAQVASLTAERNASIAAISSGPGAEPPHAIQDGMLWGQFVADSIWAWRAADGFNPNPAPPFLGSLGRPVPGVWRPTPLANGAAGASGAGPQVATMTPWVLARPNQFRPLAPYASPQTGEVDLTNAQYLADYEETKLMGAYSGPRTPDQSELALFWAGNTPPLLDSNCVPGIGFATPEPVGECPSLRTAKFGTSGRGDRLLGCQIPIRLVAADHRGA